MKRALFLFLVVLLLGLCCTHAASAVGKDIVGKEIDYASPDGVVLKGYLAFDGSVNEKRPGVLVVHEWWGHNDYARKRARMLAELGYTALAVDMYGDGKKAEHPDKAGEFAGMIAKNEALGKARFLAAMEALKGHETVDPSRIAAIGYCFGGSVVLRMARMGVDLKGVASFHGGLASSRPAEAGKPGKIRARVFVAHGGADAFEPPEDIARFREEMAQEGADLFFITYEGAKHSFTNPDADAYAKRFGIPLGYDEAADLSSWRELGAFLKASLTLPAAAAP